MADLEKLHSELYHAKEAHEEASNALRFFWKGRCLASLKRIDNPEKVTAPSLALERSVTGLAGLAKEGMEESVIWVVEFHYFQTGTISINPNAQWPLEAVEAFIAWYREKTGGS